jgi:hypothetical protein
VAENKPAKINQKIIILGFDTGRDCGKVLLNRTEKDTGTMKKHYEWSIEEIDENGEIEDVDFADKLEDLGMPTETQRLAIVLRTSNGIDNLDTFWAYVNGGKLPVHFEDSSHRIPEKFHMEIAKVTDKARLA